MSINHGCHACVPLARTQQEELTPLRGTLKKKSRHGFWQKRYFEAHNNYINYYPSEAKSKLLASLHLATVVDADLIDVFDGTFYVAVAGKKMEYKAADGDEATKWVDGVLERRDFFEDLAAKADTHKPHAHKKDKVKASKKPAKADGRGGGHSGGGAGAFTDSESDMSDDSDLSDSDSSNARKRAAHKKGKRAAAGAGAAASSDSESSGFDTTDGEDDDEPPPPPAMEGWLSKKTTSKFKKSQDRYFRLDNGTLYYYPSAESTAHTSAMTVDTIDEVRPLAKHGKFDKATKFEVVLPYNTLTLTCSTPAEMLKWVTSIEKAKAHLARYGKQTAKKGGDGGGSGLDTDLDDTTDSSDDDARPSGGRDDMPTWLRDFVRKSEGDQAIFIQKVIADVFADAEDDLTKVIDAATTLYEDLEEKAFECKTRGRFKELKQYYRFYHLKLVQEVGFFTGSEQLSKLSNEQLLRLMDWIRGYASTRKRVLDKVPTTEDEGLPPFELIDDVRLLIDRYMDLMDPRLQGYVVQISTAVTTKGTEQVEMKVLTRLGTNAPQDLFNLLNEHLTYAKEGGSVVLQRRLLCAVMGIVCLYQSMIVMDLHTRWDKREERELDMDYVCAIVNDAGAMLDHIELLENSFAQAIDPANADWDDDDGEGKADDDDGESLRAIQQDVPRAKDELIKGAIMGCQTLIKIVLADVEELLNQTFQPAAEWLAGDHMDEVAATIVDYFNDFKRFLDNYFFQRLAVMALEKLSMLYIGRLFAVARSKSNVFRQYQLTDDKVAKMTSDIDALSTGCFYKVIDKETVDKGLRVLYSVRNYLSIRDHESLYKALAKDMSRLKQHALHIFLTYETCVKLRPDIPKNKRSEHVKRAHRMVLRKGARPSDPSFETDLYTDLVNDKLDQRILESFWDQDIVEQWFPKIFNDMVQVGLAAKEEQEEIESETAAAAASDSGELPATMSFKDFIGGGDDDDDGGAAAGAGRGSLDLGGIGMDIVEEGSEDDDGSDDDDDGAISSDDGDSEASATSAGRRASVARDEAALDDIMKDILPSDKESDDSASTDERRRRKTKAAARAGRGRDSSSDDSDDNHGGGRRRKKGGRSAVTSVATAKKLAQQRKLQAQQMAKRGGGGSGRGSRMRSPDSSSDDDSDSDAGARGGRKSKGDDFSQPPPPPPQSGGCCAVM